MAAAHGQPFATTLTGFKWIGRVPGLAFGYEEAIGYCVDPGRRARQGRHLGPDPRAHAGRRAEGRRAGPWPTGSTRSPRTYGVYETDQLSVRVDDLTLIADAMVRLRAQPPTTLAGRAGRR